MERHSCRKIEHFSWNSTLLKTMSCGWYVISGIFAYCLGQDFKKVIRSFASLEISVPACISSGNFENFKKICCVYKKFFAIIQQKMQIKNSLIKNLALIFLSVLLLCFSNQVFAETLSYESALVWRTDSQGDYRLPGIVEKNTYTLTPGVSTKGVIKSMTAAWVFEGEVSLEVSADNGLHYIPAVNGVAIDENFTPGTVIKWRAYVGEDSVLNEVKITYRDSSGVVAGFDDPQLAAFKYVKSFYVGGSAEKTLFNYQLRVTVAESVARKSADIACDGRLENNFNDIRFSLPDGVTSLPYYLEKVEGDGHERIAHFFVKIPQIPKEGITLYIYYGNSKAPSLSDPDNTFDFFDDFKGTQLDAKKWSSRISPAGSLSISEKGLLLEGAGILTNVYQLRDGLVEFSAISLKGPEVRFIFHDQYPDSVTDLAQAAFSSNYEDAQHCLAVGSVVKINDSASIRVDETYDYRLVAEGSKLVFERFAHGDIQPDQQGARVMYEDTEGARRGYIGFKAGGNSSNLNATLFHWLRVRRYCASEPYVDLASVSKEKLVTLCQSKSLVPAPNGDLLLSKGQAEGYYLLPEKTLDYDARILTVFLKGENATADFSFINGENYKKDCLNNIYYYASKNDFIPGSKLKGYMRLSALSSRQQAFFSAVSVQYGAGAISVLSPNGRETLQSGMQKAIKWSAWDYERNYPMKIEYSLDRGETWSLIAERAENNGQYMWMTPKFHLRGGTFRTGLVRVCDGNDNSICDESDGVFTIRDEK